MEDWGEIKTKELNSTDLQAILSELKFDVFEFHVNIVLDAWETGDLYGLEVTETDSMNNRNARKDDIFCVNTSYLLPCFCIKQDNIVALLWTHPRAREKGFATKLLADLKLEKVWCRKEKLFPFYQKRNLQIIDELPEKIPVIKQRINNAIFSNKEVAQGYDGQSVIDDDDNNNNQ
jgi:hypothetical protein